MGKKIKLTFKIILAVIAVPIIISIFFGSSTYETDFSPPAPKANLDDIFPKSIDGKQRNIEKLPGDNTVYKGFRASYGEAAEIHISVIQSDGSASADAYFKSIIVPQVDAMVNHSRAKVNGLWFASGTDEHGGHWYGWVNHNWVFWLFGANEELFDKAIDEFSFIAR